MNMNKTIENVRPVGGDYFCLKYSRRTDKTLKDYLNLFNPNDYYIFKSTRKQRPVSYEDLLEFKYSGYIFFLKRLYDINHILKWIDWWGKLGGIQYLSKPFPPFNPDKIIIKN